MKRIPSYILYLCNYLDEIILQRRVAFLACETNKIQCDVNKLQKNQWLAFSIHWFRKNSKQKLINIRTQIIAKTVHIGNL